MSIMNDLKKILLDVNVNFIIIILSAIAIITLDVVRLYDSFAEALSKRLNKPYSMQNLSNKLRNETITHREMILIADILGYDLKFVRKNS